MDNFQKISKDGYELTDTNRKDLLFVPITDAFVAIIYRVSMYTKVQINIDTSAFHLYDVIECFMLSIPWKKLWTGR